MGLGWDASVAAACSSLIDTVLTSGAVFAHRLGDHSAKDTIEDSNHNSGKNLRTDKPDECHTSRDSSQGNQPGRHPRDWSTASIPTTSMAATGLAAGVATARATVPRVLSNVARHVLTPRVVLAGAAAGLAASASISVALAALIREDGEFVDELTGSSTTSTAKKSLAGDQGGGDSDVSKGGGEGFSPLPGSSLFQTIRGSLGEAGVDPFSLG